MKWKFSYQIILLESHQHFFLFGFPARAGGGGVVVQMYASCPKNELTKGLLTVDMLHSHIWVTHITTATVAVSPTHTFKGRKYIEDHEATLRTKKQLQTPGLKWHFIKPESRFKQGRTEKPDKIQFKSAQDWIQQFVILLQTTSIEACQMQHIRNFTMIDTNKFISKHKIQVEELPAA